MKAECIAAFSGYGSANEVDFSAPNTVSGTIFTCLDAVRFAPHRGDVGAARNDRVSGSKYTVSTLSYSVDRTCIEANPRVVGSISTVRVCRRGAYVNVNIA